MMATETELFSLARVLARIRRAGERHDQDGADLAEEIAWLAEFGLLVEALPTALSGAVTWSADPLAVARLMRRTGRASLSVGRLFEGHVNAGQLVGLYGSSSLRRQCAVRVEHGALLGVWGAEGDHPVHAEATAAGFRLSGAKVFCSGLGLVDTALVSASLEGRVRLFAVAVRDAARADHGQWTVSGMRATRSGGYDFDGVEVADEALVGGPDDYFIEPYFQGGMYRMCAVQLGGLDALLGEVAASLARRGKSSDPLAHYRVGRLASLRSMAEASVESLARGLRDEREPEALAREAILVREGVEWCVVEALQIVERGLGAEAHRETTTLSRLRRDLSFYIRQAAVDERLQSVGRWLLDQPPSE